ncbi:MAG TPA: sialate O-acetylesterase [Arachidicoccus sp.]|nr:sialate O-acetylesterase [Arachidicoccus sp.]
MKRILKQSALIIVGVLTTFFARASISSGNDRTLFFGIDRRITALSDTTAIDSSFHIFLLIGQSNMAGRAPLDSMSTVTSPNILMLDKEGRWVPAKDPLHFDKPRVAGVGPGLSFAREMLKTAPKGTKIGLVPCAWGGSSIHVWQPDSIYLHHHPYDEAIERTKIAIQRGVLSGILWHQGEADNNPYRASAYMGHLQELVNRLRSEFRNEELPFVAGEVGYFKNKNFINPVLDSIVLVIPHTGIASASGLKDKGDKTHFNTASARELGKRYAKVMRALLEKGAKPQN